MSLSRHARRLFATAFALLAFYPLSLSAPEEVPGLTGLALVEKELPEVVEAAKRAGWTPRQREQFFAHWTRDEAESFPALFRGARLSPPGMPW